MSCKREKKLQGERKGYREKEKATGREKKLQGERKLTEVQAAESMGVLCVPTSCLIGAMAAASSLAQEMYTWVT